MKTKEEVEKELAIARELLQAQRKALEVAERSDSLFCERAFRGLVADYQSKIEALEWVLGLI